MKNDAKANQPKSTSNLKRRARTINEALSYSKKLDVKFPTPPIESNALIDRKANGVAYTPTALAEYVANKAIGLLLENERIGKVVNLNSIKNWRILDPACGDGELLIASWNQLKQHIDRLPLKQHQRINPLELLSGLDIDKVAVSKTLKRLNSLAKTKVSRKSPHKLAVANALSPKNNTDIDGAWSQLRSTFDAPIGFDLIIANPPWGADISKYRHIISKSHFSLMQGQFDTSDLFVELALSQLKANGLLAFIVPDSLFNLERRALREMLSRKTKIHLIARLGEKFFEGINRACSVIICQKTLPQPNFNVECLRLTPDLRKQILNGKSTLAEAEKNLRHLVPQSRFLENRDFAFDIDARTDEKATISKLKALPNVFADYVYSSRGVELSKYGQVSQCPTCSKWVPKPSRNDWVCPHCRVAASLDNSRVEGIISEIKAKGYAPILVGESIRRYAIGQPLWIKLNCIGIKYKEPKLYRGPKLLIRKTGVGISASIDYSGALTNQVVYIFRLLENNRNLVPIEVYLAILNSRAMYYYLVKQHGETEWRSHPYVTQSQILNLPLPDIEKAYLKNSEKWKQVTRLLSTLLKNGKPPSTLLDANLEKLVADTLGLTIDDYKIIFETLDSLEELLPVRALRHVSIKDIFPTGK